MTPAGSSAVQYTPIFDWHPPRSRRASLLSFIAASAVVHALCFYVFQIVYPPTVALLPPPARVTIITPDSEDGRLLLRWIEAEDPALSSVTQRPPDAAKLDLPKVEHIPSYLAARPALREPAPYQPDLSIPSSRPPGPVPVPHTRQTAPMPVSSSTIAISENLQSLGAPELPPPKFTVARQEAPAPAEFRIAVGASGEVRHCFLQATSGDPALDEQARAYLLQCRFPAGERELAWGRVIFEWGNDLVGP